jgi:predicted Zn-dependent protease
MKKNIFFVLLTMLMIIQSCNKIPITNRRQLNLQPESTMIEMAEVAYTKFLAENPPLPQNDERSQRVERIGKKIAAEVESYLKKNGHAKRIEGFKWEFKTVDQPVVNAWCMPGGKVVVYTEIMKLATDDDMLAVIMGHEIAHAIARHGNERMSQALAVKGMGTIVGGVFDTGSEASQNIFLQSYGLVSALGMLSYSRKHETEADKMGLVFMALAGYNPEKAIDFWQKMASMGGDKPPQMLSTHPSDEKRIQDIKDFLPKIPKYLSKK